LDTVAGEIAAAVAVNETGVPTVTPAPESGLVIATVGTVILTTAAAELAIVPAESIALAERLNTPAPAGFH
jgi:hypothetical protein